MILLIVVIVVVCVVIRFLSKTSVFSILFKLWRSFEDHLYVYQSYRVPKFNDNLQENLLYRKVSTYLHSLPSIEDSDFTNMFTGSKPNDIVLHIDAFQKIRDVFLGAGVSWTNEKLAESDLRSAFVLRLRKKDKRRILRPYMQHILSVADDIDQRKTEVMLNVNMEIVSGGNGRWRPVPFTHPATMETIVMDGDLKNKIKADLEVFVKSKQYYNKLGRVWKRSYLLYGASGTGKTSFIAAIAKFLSYDVYDIDLSKVKDDSDLKQLLLQTTSKSIIVIEDLDRFLSEKPTNVTLSGLLNFMDGITSCCSDERIMIFTMNSKDQVDEAILRPGRIDVHIHFPLCNFSSFKGLANNYLGVKEHKLFSQVEEIIQNGASLTQAEISEIMIANRTSPTRAIKSVISALQINGGGGDAGKTERKISGSGSGSGQSADETNEPGSLIYKESVQTIKEFKKLYGLIRLGSRRKDESVDLIGSAEKDGSRHDS